MKKKLSVVITSVALAAIMAFALTACGSSSTSTTAAQAAGGSSDMTLAVAGQLNIATNAEFAPYEYKDGDSYAGIDMEISKAIADKLGLEWVINDVEFGSIIGGVQSGKYDMGMAGMTVTEERLESVNFSDTYATGVQVIVVNNGSSITSPDDLSDAMIGVQADTTGDIYCCSDFGDDHVTEYKTVADAIQALIAGKVDCVVCDNEPAKSYVESAGADLTILDTAYTIEEYAICVSKDNPALLEAINGALKELQEAGTIDEIIAKYIK